MRLTVGHCEAGWSGMRKARRTGLIALMTWLLHAVKDERDQVDAIRHVPLMLC
jgi:hypothetical protein